MGAPKECENSRKQFSQKLKAKGTMWKTKNLERQQAFSLPLLALCFMLYAFCF